MVGYTGDNYLRDDTICAPFTPPGKGAMSAIRLSGPEAFAITDAVFKPVSKTQWVERQLNIGEVRDGDEIIDRPLAAKFLKPNSFTGEDVVEFHVHGSPYIVRRVIQTLAFHGAREAMPGEFSLRAFMNGRMDLTQAEGLADLINARTEAQHKAALAQLSGGLREKVGDIRNSLLRLLGAVEVTFDHPGEVVEAESIEPAPVIDNHIADLKSLIDTYERGRLLREGLRLGIFGRPNVGKSSLMNRLLGRRRALVADEPGTTRDVIEAPLDIAGIEMNLIDTAGLRTEATGLEAAGQELTKEEIRDADVKLIMIDGSFSVTPDDIAVFSQVTEGKIIVIINKIDLPQAIELADVEMLAAGKPIAKISCLTGEGIGGLLAAIEELVLSGEGEISDLIITNSRHHTALSGALECLHNAASIFAGGFPEDLAAMELRLAIEKLQGITGGDFSEDLYATIFSEFCLGK